MTTLSRGCDIQRGLCDIQRGLCDIQRGLCDVYATHFIDCMKQKAKVDKCKTEFEIWDLCCKNTYLSASLFRSVNYTPNFFNTPSADSRDPSIQDCLVENASPQT